MHSLMVAAESEGSEILRKGPLLADVDDKLIHTLYYVLAQRTTGAEL